MATRNAFDAQPPAPNNAVFLDCPISVLGAGWLKPTSLAQERRYETSIEPNHCQYERFHLGSHLTGMPTPRVESQRRLLLDMLLRGWGAGQ